MFQGVEANRRAAENEKGRNISERVWQGAASVHVKSAEMQHLHKVLNQYTAENSIFLCGYWDKMSCLLLRSC